MSRWFSFYSYDPYSYIMHNVGGDIDSMRGLRILFKHPKAVNPNFAWDVWTCALSEVADAYLKVELVSELAAGFESLEQLAAYHRKYHLDGGKQFPVFPWSDFRRYVATDIDEIEKILREKY